MHVVAIWCYLKQFLGPTKTCEQTQVAIQACEWISNHITLVFLRSVFLNNCCNCLGLWDWIFEKPYYRWWLNVREIVFAFWWKHIWSWTFALTTRALCYFLRSLYLWPMIPLKIVIYVELYFQNSKRVDGMKGKVRSKSVRASQISLPQQQMFASLNSHQQSMWQNMFIRFTCMLVAISIHNNITLSNNITIMVSNIVPWNAIKRGYRDCGYAEEVLY